MHSVSNLYLQILADRNHKIEPKLLISGTEYSQSDIVQDSLRVYGGLYSNFGIGNCSARQIDVRIIPKGTIPRQSKIEVFVRLTLENKVSEWIPKGVFFFATRKTDRQTGVLTVHGYDAMLKAEETWLNNSYASANFPMAPKAAVDDIAARMGISVDKRTNLNSVFPVQYPADEDGDMSMREVLARIAVANAGNWIITDSGELLLVSLNSMPPETHYLIDDLGSAVLFGGVRILV